ncbi:hypothetical protein G9F72_022905 [Clostridium estertheticum]|uniref:hypothetical protein n=1 Tax=Clostridium estertheticum TaxID=238834 RepID=UPI0013E932DF|nr:hypothetical protein [Clostridium estertheticum]MBZ9689151.1 hypothetical protein [Clostridium estertheticum]
MGFGGLFISIIISFAIIYFAVRLAINPLLHSQEELIEDNQDSELIKLRDMGILNNTELEEVINLYQNNNDKKEDPEAYEKYIEILNDLKVRGYFTDEQYDERIENLKNYFKGC